MQNNTHPSQILPENRKGAGNTFQLILQSQYYLDTTKGITRKLQSNIPHEHRWKNVYQIISKSNPATKGLYTMTNLDLTQEYKVGGKHENQLCNTTY